MYDWGYEIFQSILITITRLRIPCVDDFFMSGADCSINDSFITFDFISFKISCIIASMAVSLFFLISGSKST
jgi:hypothetical protein